MSKTGSANGSFFGNFIYDQLGLFAPMENTILKRAHLVEDWEIEEDNPMRDGKALRHESYRPDKAPWFEAFDAETAIGAWNQWAETQP